MQLKDIDLSEKTKLLHVDKIKNDFTVDAVVNKLKGSDAIASSLTKEFKKGVQLFVIAMLSKFFERESIRICCTSICKHFLAIENVIIAKRKAAWEIESSSEVLHWESNQWL